MLTFYVFPPQLLLPLFLSIGVTEIKNECTIWEQKMLLTPGFNGKKQIIYMTTA